VHFYAFSSEAVVFVAALRGKLCGWSNQ